jgi:hypothetical protein
MIAPIARKVRKAGKRIAAPDVPPALFHRLRVHVKRLRYAFEMLPGMCGKRSRKALARLEQMQELLGAHQDLVAMLEWLLDYAGGAHDVAPETLMAVGALVQTLGERRRKLAVQTYRRWRKVARAGVIKDALNEISRLAQRRLESNREAQAEAEYQAKAEADRQKQTQTERQAPAENEHPAPAEAEPQLPTESTADADALPCAPPNHVTAESVASAPGASTPPGPSADANAAALDDAVESAPAHHHNHD